MAKLQSTSDLKTLLHYNRPKSTPPTKHSPGTVSSETSFNTHAARATSVSLPHAHVPSDTEDNESQPLLDVSRERSAFQKSREFLQFTLKQYFQKDNYKLILNHLKILILFSLTVIFCIFIAIGEENEHMWHKSSVSQASSKDVPLNCEKSKKMIVMLNAPVVENASGAPNLVLATISAQGKRQNWTLAINSTLRKQDASNTVSHTFEINHKSNVTLEFSTDSDESVGFDYQIHFEKTEKIILAAIVLSFVYLLIIFELTHRTIAALLGSLAATAVLSYYGERPSVPIIMEWIDWGTLMLLFGMMILVAIFSDTGFFDTCALKAYKMAKGNVWTLVTLLCLFSAVVSAFLDNVTTILLLTPVTIKLCEVLNLDPRRILIAEVLFSNIGGTATAIGDPPNVIIISNKEISEKGIQFANFTLHMTVGIIFVTLVGYGALRFKYRNLDSLKNKDPPQIAELKHEIELWRRAAARISVASREESIMKALFLQKYTQRENSLVRKLYRIRNSEIRDFRQNLEDLEKKYCITDTWLLVKSAIILAVAIIMFFIYSFVPGIFLDIGWIAIMAAVLLLVLTDLSDLETILHRVEWSTLLFFAALFVLMEALNELQLIDFIGEKVSSVISGVDKDYKLAVALLMIIWVSALASSFIDNIPFTTAMIPVLLQLHNESPKDLPLLPLVLALAFGACLGGNGTLVGASANLVCAGIAEQHGYGFSFKEFFKIGFPMMIVTNLVATAYIIICHVAVKWHPH